MYLDFFHFLRTYTICQINGSLSVVEKVWRLLLLHLLLSFDILKKAPELCTTFGFRKQREKRGICAWLVGWCVLHCLALDLYSLAELRLEIEIKKD